MSRQKTERSGPQWARAIPAFGIGAILAVWLVAGGADGESLEYLIGRLAGAVLVTALLAMVLLWRSPLWFRLVWLGMYAFFLLGIGGLGLYVREETRAVRAFEQDMAEASGQMRAAIVAIEQGREPGRITMAEPDATRVDRFADGKRAWRSFLQARLDNQARYRAELEASEWFRILETSELRGAGARARVEARSAAARAAVDGWIERERATTEAFLAAWAAADLPARARRGFDADEVRGNNEARLTRSRATETAVIDAGIGVAEVLLRHRWEMDGDMIVFYSEEALLAHREAQEELDRRIRQSGDELRRQKNEFLGNLEQMTREGR